MESFEFVFHDEFKATIVLFCLKNEMVYANALRKINNEKDYRSVKFMLDYLTKKGILRVLSKEETKINFPLKSKMGIFMRIIIRNCPNAGYYHAKKTKFYTLTKEAKEFFSLFEGRLRSISNHVEDIENFGEILSKTHKELEELKNKQSEILQKCILVLRGNLDKPMFSHYLGIWCNKVLLKYSIFLTPKELETIVKTNKEKLKI